MELIDVSGYILEEKVEIAKKFLVPKQLKEHGFEEKEISFPKKVLVKIVESYTRESGVRQLEKKIAKVMRRIALQKASGKPFEKTVSIDGLKEYLGQEEFSPDRYEGNDQIGVVTGLAWTAVGGEILLSSHLCQKAKARS